jgi:hypothetical protein
MENRSVAYIFALWTGHGWIVRRLNSEGAPRGVLDHCGNKNTAIYMVLMYAEKFPDAEVVVPKSMRPTVRKFLKKEEGCAKIFRKTLDYANNIRLL